MKRTGGCNCIKEFDEGLRKLTGDPDAMLELVIGMDGSVYPYMYSLHRERKGNGIFKTKKSQRVVIPNYCPFCGRKYVTRRKR